MILSIVLEVLQRRSSSMNIPAHARDMAVSFLRSMVVPIIMRVSLLLLHVLFPDLSIESLEWEPENGTLLARNISVGNRYFQEADLPFRVNAVGCQMAKLTYTNQVHIDFFICHLDIDVTKTTESIFPRRPQQSSTETEIAIYSEIEDGLVILTDHVKQWMQSVAIAVHTVTCDFTSSIQLTDESSHRLRLSVAEMNCLFEEYWKISLADVRFWICPPVRAMGVQCIHVSFKESDIVVVCSEPVKVALCGDSYFLFTVFLQHWMENQRWMTRTIMKRMETSDCAGTCAADHHDPHDHYDRRDRLALDLVESMNDPLSTAFSCREKRPSEQRPSRPRNLWFRDWSVICEFYKGSDMQQSRVLSDCFAFRLTKADMLVQPDKLSATVGTIHSTVGFVDEPTRISMKYHLGYWDMKIALPLVHVKTSQAVVNNMMVLFNFNALWHDYEILCDHAESIKFRTIRVQQVAVRFKYHNKPNDYKKILKGNWKHVLACIPHCDLSITLPSVHLSYQTGWEDALDAYLKELSTTQRLKCLRKTVVGTAKRKFKELLK